MKLLPVILLSLCTACASNPDAEAHRLALWNFTYEEDKANEYRIYDSISSPFVGDCEDLSFTLQSQIGGDVWYVILENGDRHAVLVKNGMVYDSISSHVVKMKDYNGEFVFIMDMSDRKSD